MKIISALLRATLLMPLAAQAAAPQRLRSMRAPMRILCSRSPQARRNGGLSGHRAAVKVDAAGTRTSYAINMKAHWFPGVLRVLVELPRPPMPGFAFCSKCVRGQEYGPDCTSRRTRAHYTAVRQVERGSARLRIQLRGLS